VYSLKLSDPFINDVDSSIKYIKQNLQAPAAAQNLKDEIKNSYKKIKKTPFIYPLVPDKYLASLGYRFKMVKNYILFYTVENTVIEIIRFLYGHRDWMSILRESEK
jgi:plasmid stabilization system protein ParE